MTLSEELVRQLAKSITDNTKKTNTETTVYGTTVEYDGKIYVKLDGADRLTPVNTTTVVKPDERVTVMIKNHTATITGNMSSPAARNEDVDKVATKVTEFEIVMAYKVTTEDLEAINATIDSLHATLVNSRELTTDELTAIEAEIESLRTIYIDSKYISADEMTVINAAIDYLEVKVGEFTNISSETLEAIDAEINNLRGYSADFTYVSADVMNAVKATINNLETNKLSAEDAKIKYAEIDFANIDEAAIKKFFSKSGIIKELAAGDAVITGELVGVTINADLIKTGQLVADRLVVKGEDGIYYKLNMEAGAVASAEISEEQLGNGLHGSAIITQTITAEKISVKDLVAFGASIGGINISESSVYSGSKESVDNTTTGFYMDSDGQLGLGDSVKFLKFYKDENGNYKLDISADSLTFGSDNTSVSDALEAINSTVASLKVASDNITATVTNQESRINDVDTDLQNKFNEISLMFQITVDGVTIGRIESPYKLLMDDNEFSMTANGERVLWFEVAENKHEANIPELKVTKSMNLLDYLIEEDEHGVVSCAYVGE